MYFKIKYFFEGENIGGYEMTSLCALKTAQVLQRLHS